MKFLEQQERIDEAEALLRDIVKTTPDNLQLETVAGRVYCQPAQPGSGRNHGKGIYPEPADIYELRFALGKIHMALRQYEEAEAVYAEVIADVDGADSCTPATSW